MESNNNYVIMVTIDWHQVTCIAYVVTSNHIFFDENQWVTLICWNIWWCTKSLGLEKR